MSKETSAFFLILFLFILLLGWWATSSFRVQVNRGTLTPLSTASSTADSALQITHTTSGNKNIYSGSLDVSGCDEFSTGISAQGTRPPRLRFTFKVEKTTVCTTPPAMVTVPFSVTFSMATSTQKPILESVEVNNTPVSFSIIEGSR